MSTRKKKKIEKEKENDLNGTFYTAHRIGSYTHSHIILNEYQFPVGKIVCFIMQYDNLDEFYSL